MTKRIYENNDMNENINKNIETNQIATECFSLLYRLDFNIKNLYIDMTNYESVLISIYRYFEFIFCNQNYFFDFGEYLYEETNFDATIYFDIKINTILNDRIRDKMRIFSRCSEKLNYKFEEVIDFMKNNHNINIVIECDRSLQFLISILK